MKDIDRIRNLESRMSSIEGKVDNIDEKLDTVLAKLNGFVESSIDLKHLEKEYEKFYIKNELEHKNFMSKVGVITASTLLGILFVAGSILQLFLK